MEPIVQTISVLIPTYNRASHLRATIKSVLDQTYYVDEVIVADDGSTDETAEIVQTLCCDFPEYAGRIKYFYQPNQGKSVALNNALLDATGLWIAFNDSDDRWLPEKLELQFEALNQYPNCGACVTDAHYMDEAGRRSSAFDIGGRCFAHHSGVVDDAKIVTAMLSHGMLMPTLIVRTDVLRIVGELDPEYRVAQDVDLFFRLSLRTSIAYVNEPLVEVDRYVARRSGRLTDMHPMTSMMRLRIHERMYLKWLSLVRNSDGDLVSVLRRRLCSTRSAIANGLISERDRHSAIATLDDALQTCRTPALALKRLLFLFLPVSVSRFLIVRRALRRR